MFELIAPRVTQPAAPMAAPIARADKLHGIDWEGIAAESRGEVAMFTVAADEAGKLQSWL